MGVDAVNVFQIAAVDNVHRYSRAKSQKEFLATRLNIDYVDIVGWKILRSNKDGFYGSDWWQFALVCHNYCYFLGLQYCLIKQPLYL